MERVAVTGADGFIGRSLVAYLRGRSFWVRAVGSPGAGAVAEHANEHQRLDLRRLDDALLALRGVGHVYALGGPLPRDRPRGPVAGGLRDELLVTANLLRAAASQGVNRYLYAAPGCVREPQGPAADASCCLAYRSALELLRAASHETGLEVRIALLANVYGACARPGDVDASAVHQIVMAAAGTLPGHDGLIQLGTNRPTAFCHVDDCAEALYLLMRSNHRRPLPLHHPERLTLGQVVEAVSRLSVRPLAVVESDQPRVFSAPAGAAQPRSALGWAPTTAIEAGLARLYHQLRERPAGTWPDATPSNRCEP